MAHVMKQPEVVDIADIEFCALSKVWRSKQLQVIDISKIKNWEQIIPLCWDGKNFDGSDASRQGILP